MDFRLKLRWKLRQMRITLIKIAIALAALFVILCGVLLYRLKPEVPYADVLISQAQMLEDYDSFWQTVENDINFPKIVWQSRGLDYAAWRDENRARITEDMQPRDFAVLMRECGDLLEGAGHFYVMTKDEMYSQTDEDGNIIHRYGYVAEMLESARVSGFYTLGFYSKIESSLRSRVSLYTTGPVSKPEFGQLTSPYVYCYTGKNEQEKTAIMHVQSFRSTRTPGMVSLKLLEFYDEIKDYDHLIIDVRNNAGGYMDNWRVPIVAMLTKEDLRHEWYITMDSGENGWKYLDTDAWQARGGEPAAQWVQKHPEARDFLERYYGGDALVYKMSESVAKDRDSIGFDGKIWVLANGRSFSAADWFVRFCMETGFATVIGTRTGGNGVLDVAGNNYGYIQLPNSGLVYSYFCEVGINADGTSNLEQGTMPDIYTQGDALELCLELIRSGEWE